MVAFKYYSFAKPSLKINPQPKKIAHGALAPSVERDRRPWTQQSSYVGLYGKTRVRLRNSLTQTDTTLTQKRIHNPRGHQGVAQALNILRLVQLHAISCRIDVIDTGQRSVMLADSKAFDL